MNKLAIKKVSQGRERRGRKINKREEDILKWHWAGKKHSWICRKYKVTKRDIENLMLKYGKEKSDE